ncbi:hypothetical protein BD410DRAFT_810204 [Rickenella mellea]|uniref:Uncharacterized protein n=1 Tax=Rickenella mellea TaxID=50990 RepID=A0A4Y7PFM5_9AGAM|nr:hypothetical protein BD410DRAFT_810204 [Rickenella mellea]
MARPRKYHLSIDAFEARRVQKKTWEERNRDKRTAQKRVLRKLKPLQRTTLVKPPFVPPGGFAPHATESTDSDMAVKTPNPGSPETHPSSLHMADESPNPGSMDHEATLAELDSYLARSMSGWPSADDFHVLDVYAYAQTALSVWLGPDGSLREFGWTICEPILTEEMDEEGVFTVIKLLRKFSKLVDDLGYRVCVEMDASEEDVVRVIKKLRRNCVHIEEALWQLHDYVRDYHTTFIQLEANDNNLLFQTKGLYVDRLILSNNESDEPTPDNESTADNEPLRDDEPTASE